MKHVLTALNGLVWLVLITSFLQVLAGSGAPFVQTADEKLKIIFGADDGLLFDASLVDAPPFAEQHLVDLGSGSGAVVRSATRLGGFGSASGYEINPALYGISVAMSSRAAAERFTLGSLWDALVDDADVVVVYALPELQDAMGTKLAHECKVGALIVSNAYAFPNAESLGLQLLREQRVETSWWNPDGTSSLWLYRVRGVPDPRGGSGGRGGGSFVRSTYRLVHQDGWLRPAASADE